jgi:hypothetical protein
MAITFTFFIIGMSYLAKIGPLVSEMSKVDISILVTAVIFEGNLAPCVNLLKMCPTGLSTFKYDLKIGVDRIGLH